MCGFAGKLVFDASATVDPALLTRMAQAIAHRGPDDEGIWSRGAVGLASRRLAVIDLSPRGHQPMASADGTCHIAFNGEIYNFLELRRELVTLGHTFASDSDTEVILHLYQEHGADAVKKLRGMFAFALWDEPRRRLLLARDRLGKKPLFYYRDERMIVFGSEPKAILQDANVPAEASTEAIAYYLGLGYVPGELSAFRHLKRLLPAHLAVVDQSTMTVSRYWSLQYLPKRTGSEDALAAELEAKLREAVRLRLISDVPVGALLSGGLDSSAIVALMCDEHAGPVKTFSIGFDEARYDERAHAQAVAAHLGTEHRDLIVRPQATAMMERLVWHYNEPFADSSALPSMAVSELARREVTVALNGDGGDEAFVGYDRYLALAVSSRLDAVPIAGRRLLRQIGARLPLGQPKSLTYRVRRFAEALPRDPVDRYAQWTTVFDREARRELFTSEFARSDAGADAEALIRDTFDLVPPLSVVERAVRSDVLLYLPDDLLVKMDIASMAYSLEVRSPFLDHEVVEFAASLPLNLKLRGTVQKYLLRRAIAGRLPPSILRRPKMGFGVPLDRWFGSELREMANDILLGERARSRGYFQIETVRRYLDEHASGRAFHHHQLWALLQLELWHRAFIDRRCAAEPPVSATLDFDDVTPRRAAGVPA